MIRSPGSSRTVLFTGVSFGHQSCFQSGTPICCSVVVNMQRFCLFLVLFVLSAGASLGIPVNTPSILTRSSFCGIAPTTIAGT